jgi:hypothetical protein
MPRSPDFFTGMSTEDLEAFEAFAREPGRTVDDCHEWLLAKGYTPSRSAVGRWKKKFDAQDRLRAASTLAADVLATAKDAGAVSIGDAATHTLTQVLFEQLLRMQGDEDVKSGDLVNISTALRGAMSVKKQVNELKAQQADAMKAAEAMAKSGKSATDVVATIKAALGLVAA